MTIDFPAGNRNNVIYLLFPTTCYDIFLVNKFSIVNDNAIRIYSSRNRATGIDFSFNRISILRECAIFSNCTVGIIVNRSTFAFEGESREGIASGTNIYVGTLGADMRTKSFGGFVRTGNVRHACIIRDAFPRFENKLIDPSSATTMATACSFCSTIQYILNRQVNVRSSCLSRYLHAICQGAESSMRPAASAVLR